MRSIKADVQSKLNLPCVVKDKEVLGRPITTLISEMRDMGWKNIGAPHKFEAFLEQEGFTIHKGHLNFSRKSPARIVYVKQ